MTQTLTEFLLARIAEDEEAARVAARCSSWDWTAHGSILLYLDADRNAEPLGQVENYRQDDALRHIARYGPTRVLAECEAKRRIADMHTSDATWDGGEECAQCSFHEAYEGFNDVSETFPCTTLRLLALPYADHPSFDPAWAVE